MAATPKIVRTTAKRLKKEVSNYFGFPIRARVKFGEESYSQTHRKGKNTRGVILINKRLKTGKISLSELNLFLRHELFHIAGDSFTLRNASTTFSATNEAIALLSNAESEIKNSKSPFAREEYLESLIQTLRFDPPRYETHLVGSIICYNIVKRFSTAKLRQKYVKYLLRQNSQALNDIRNKKAQFLGVSDFGEIQIRKV